jgi:prevent-host-death family protein
MTEVASRLLRNDTRALLRRVEAGEDLTITVDGRAVAVLRPVSSQQRWMSGTELARRLGDASADPGLAAELAALAPETTADLPDL